MIVQVQGVREISEDEFHMVKELLGERKTYPSHIVSVAVEGYSEAKELLWNRYHNLNYGFLEYYEGKYYIVELDFEVSMALNEGDFIRKFLAIEELLQLGGQCDC